MPRKEHHVVPNTEGGWDIKKNNAERSSGHFDKKQDAVDRGREISTNQGRELIIHRKDCSIECSDSLGNDPNPPKDKDTH